MVTRTFNTLAAEARTAWDAEKSQRKQKSSQHWHLLLESFKELGTLQPYIVRERPGDWTEATNQYDVAIHPPQSVTFFARFEFHGRWLQTAFPSPGRFWRFRIPRPVVQTVPGVGLLIRHPTPEDWQYTDCPLAALGAGMAAFVTLSGVFRVNSHCSIIGGIQQ